jgi:hypothetical protein
MVPQPFAAGGNQPYLEFWAITGHPRYPGYITPIVLSPDDLLTQTKCPCQTTSSFFWLNVLSQVNLPLELLSLCLRGDRHATSEDEIDLSQLFIVIWISSAMFSSMGFPRHRCCWWWHLFAIQKSFTLFHIVSCSTMDLAPFFCVSRVMEWSLLLHIRGLLLVIPMISVISAIPTIFPISCVDLTIVLLLLQGPLAP